VLNGCDGSTSVNNFDVDISSGQIIIGDNIVDVASTTVSHSTSDPEDRIDLITANSNGTVSITQGSPASTSGQPVAPDIPTSDILLVLVYIRGGSTEILTGDIFNDYKTQIKRGVPSGVITMWGGATANIPNGWALCDGTNGTPDLRDRFVVGAGNTYNVDDTGGADSVQLTEAEMPSHSHNFTLNNETSGGSPGLIGRLTGSATVTTNTVGGDQGHENRPPYYALAYIQKL